MFLFSNRERTKGKKKESIELAIITQSSVGRGAFDIISGEKGQGQFDTVPPPIVIHVHYSPTSANNEFIMSGREQMNAIVVERYGGVEQLVHKRIDKPSVSDGHDVLVK